MSRPLRIALTKGRLEDDFLALMEGAGYDMGPLREKGRKLIVRIPGPGEAAGEAPGGAAGEAMGGAIDEAPDSAEEGAVEIFLAKAPDVVTCVEQGVCDVGIVGKDTLLEQGGTYYEIMDLGLGKCRFALAAPSGGAVAKGAAPRVVASKYPQYAGRWFERRGLDVRIIRIEGSVEIAPLLGLADSVVDIVETGTTLRENGLEVVEYIRDISARLIVNVTGMKLRKSEVEALAARLAP
ncbi:MAG: ATP phosphoribosyltransferase [Clostridiales bacterium]|nr:ATP phosphoribosyltransferase [Clostridiales bacterium]